jgi:hypothetical protein
MINIENDITEKRKKEIEYNTRHLLSKDDLEKGLFKIKTPLIKITVGLFIMLLLLIIGLYLK